jgi:uroporphyrinogen decarboxylase-like protein
MNSKEKLKLALNHKDGPLAVDFGSTSVTGIHVSIVENLRKYYSLEKIPIKVWEPYQMLGVIDDDLRQIIGIDTIGIPAPMTIFGFPLQGWKQWQTPWGQEVLVPEKFTVVNKENGTYIFPEGDVSVKPSAHMPCSSYFFDAIVRQPEIDESKLDPKDNLQEFGVISDENLNYYAKMANSLSDSGQGVVATLPGMALGDIALIPAPFLKNPKGIRDITEWYISIAMREDYVRAIFERQVELAIPNLEKIYKAVGNKIDVVFLCATDFGTQTGTFCSIDTFNSLWKPYYQKINGWIHDHTQWKTFKHSCGAVFDFIEGFIDAGFDIINPVQCSATGMDPVSLKNTYGDRIVFWGAGCDTQKILPFGTPEQVREDVLTKCEIFSKNGGFVFNAIHNVQAKSPTKNVVAMFDAIKKFQ